jgi:hypothetical protein
VFRDGVPHRGFGRWSRHLVFGGAWGLRLKTGGPDWNLDDPDQWGEAYLLLGGDGSDLRFGSTSSA